VQNPVKLNQTATKLQSRNLSNNYKNQTYAENLNLMKQKHDIHFFSQHSINRWNSLIRVEIDAKSINSVKNYLEKRRKRQVDFFMD